MDNIIRLNDKEIRLGFVASCIEFVSERLGKTYADVYQRMKRADMLTNYIYEFYDVLHTESCEHLTEDLIDLLKRREAKLQCK